MISTTIIVAVMAGVGAAALLGSVSMFLQKDEVSAAEDRLSVLTANKRGKGGAEAEVTLLSKPLGDTTNVIEEWINNSFNIQRLLDQADLRITVMQLAGISIGGAVIGFLGMLMTGLPTLFAPMLGFLFLILPIIYLNMRKNSRMTKFNKQLPEALELLGRSLRAGHSLAAGFGLVAAEMPDPIRREFGRCFEEQNFGIQLEESLDAMTERIPNMDLRFLATAIILQRQTGGDLAEILDKISRLIRERFKLAGQIQALTGEGRLSGIVLFALPPGLFCVMYFLNRDYIMSLFKDDMGRYLLGGAIVMQLMGAFVIRKIVDIKV